MAESCVASLRYRQQLQSLAGSRIGLMSEEREMSNAQHWERLLVRSGIWFLREGNSLFLGEEPDYNQAFIRKVLKETGYGGCLDGVLLDVSEAPPVEQAWLMAWEKLKRGAESGPKGFRHIELACMDTYMAGVVRWLNAHGIDTSISCDGHGRKLPWLELRWGADGAVVNDLARALTNGRLAYEGDQFNVTDVPLPKRFPRELLLEFAEKLHEQFCAEGGKERRSAQPGARLNGGDAKLEPRGGR
jgi:hypothetical protein